MTRLILPLLLSLPLPALAEPVIAFSGEAEFGVTYAEGAGADPHGRFTLDTETSVATDNGLTLGAQLRLRAGAGERAQLAGTRVYVTTGTPGQPPRR